MEKWDIWIVLGAVLLSMVLLIAGFSQAALETGNWGLAFPVPGQSPAGPVSQEELEKYGASFLGNQAEKVLYLTFDAGYENGYTGRILDTLNKHNAPGAFFLVSHYMKENPDLVRRMQSEGHIVGNHTMRHPDMSKKTTLEEFAPELTELEALYESITGAQLGKFYRPPQGVYSQENLELAKELGYHTVFWSLAHADWDNDNQPDPDKAMEKLLSRTHPGAIVLLHTNSKTNAEILDRLMTAWEEMGYRFGSLEELTVES